MLYIDHKNGFTRVVFKEYTRLINKSNLSVIKKLCKAHLFMYDNKIKLTKECLNIKSKPPLYINAKILLIPTASPRNYDTVWVNYFKILHITKINRKTLITFDNLLELIVEVSYSSFNKSMKQAQQLLNYTQDVFEEYSLSW